MLSFGWFLDRVGKTEKLDQEEGKVYNSKENKVERTRPRR